MSDAPGRCIACGSRDLEGPWGNVAVWFCNGCGRTVRPGETLEDVHRRAKLDATRQKVRQRHRDRVTS